MCSTLRGGEGRKEHRISSFNHLLTSRKSSTSSFIRHLFRKELERPVQPSDLQAGQLAESCSTLQKYSNLLLWISRDGSPLKPFSVRYKLNDTEQNNGVRSMVSKQHSTPKFQEILPFLDLTVPSFRPALRRGQDDSIALIGVSSGAQSTFRLVFCFQIPSDTPYDAIRGFADDASCFFHSNRTFHHLSSCGRRSSWGL